jgi:glycerate kinase
VRVVLAPGPLDGLSAPQAVRALRAGWTAVSPSDELLDVPLPTGPGAEAARELLAGAVVGADLVVTATSVLAAAALTAPAPVALAVLAAAEQGVPCVAVAWQVHLGERERAAAGLADALAPEPGGVGARGLQDLARSLARDWSPT